MKKTFCLKDFVNGHFKMKRIALAGVLCCLLVFGLTGSGAAATINYFTGSVYYGDIESIEGITVGSETFDVTFKYDTFNNAIGDTVLTPDNAGAFVDALLNVLNGEINYTSSTEIVGSDPDNPNGFGHYSSTFFYIPFGDWYEGGYSAEPQANMDYVISYQSPWIKYGPMSCSISLDSANYMWASVTTASSPVSSAVPIPGAVWLLGSGLVGLVGCRRKFSS